MRKTMIVVAAAVHHPGPGFSLAQPRGGLAFAHPGGGYGLGHFDGSFGGHRFGGSPYHGGYDHGGESFYRGYPYRAARESAVAALPYLKRCTDVLRYVFIVPWR
jgi:hypothetical protein